MDAVAKRWLQMDMVAKNLVVNYFPTKFAGEIAGYIKSMGEIHRYVNSCNAMVTTWVDGGYPCNSVTIANARP